MTNATRSFFWGLVVFLVTASAAQGQNQYIGYVYPAGGQQGTTLTVKLGGQRLDGIYDAIITGEGVSAKVVQYYRRRNNQEFQLLTRQLRELTQGKPNLSKAMIKKMVSFKFPEPIGPKNDSEPAAKAPARNANAHMSPYEQARKKLIERIQRLRSADQRQPACASLAELVFLEVTIAPDAKPGRREIRLVTRRGVTNPLPFYVGQEPETTRKPLGISKAQVLGKEYLAQRKRPPEEEEMRISLPCTMNGQVASGEVNRYRFRAKKGQHLVISVKARDLVPYIADAVPGWFQPVVWLCDARGRELVYADDFRFKPDPTLCFDVPADGEYVLSITDAIYRGREDFVYRITIGEIPFLTSIFPLGAQAGQPARIEMDGWNLDKAVIAPPPKNAAPGIYLVTATRDKCVSNSKPFAIDTLPECLDRESNNTPVQAQKVKLPVIVNGRIDRPDDWDVFEIQAAAGQTLVAEVLARRLDSPLDSFLKVTDAAGNLLAVNDDHHDAASGMNTDHADSYLMVQLPAAGKYYVHLGDTRRHGGKAYAYRLRLSPPRPDFQLRIMPSRISMPSRKAASVTVFAIRKDGFNGPITLNFENLPNGFASSPAVLGAKAASARLTLKTTLAQTDRPLAVTVVGSAKIGDKRIVHKAVAAEDRMQAFLWRHLLTADELVATVYNPSYRPTQTRTRPPIPEHLKPKPRPGAPKYTEKQVAGRIRQIERLYQEWLLTDDFANREIAQLKSGS